MKTSAFLTLSFSFFILLGFSQKTLSGVVKSEDGSAIPYAKIRVNESQKGTISDVEGKFKIENMASASKQIIVSALGYAEQEILIEENTSNIEVQLFKQVQNLETVGRRYKTSNSSLFSCTN